ncbi:MAG: NAD-dependent epimerase/dehydratase family protein [Myxococcales bacterium]|nr:NAD-dependent epimerase/dehydratase family protein [Myxococcales bacterium]
MPSPSTMLPAPPTTLILGGGFTGVALIRHLVSCALPVTATSTSEAGAQTLTGLGAAGVVWRAPAPGNTASLPVDADRVIILFPPKDTDSEALASALRRPEGAPQRRVVYCSSTSVYGDRSGGEVTETTPASPDSPWGLQRALAEDAFRAVGAVIVRAAGIYGPGRNLIERHRAGQMRNAGDRSRRVNLIHVDDLAAILLAALENGIPGENLVAATGAPVPWEAMAAIAVARTGLPLPPESPVPADPNLASFYKESKWCRPTAFERLGVTLSHPDSLAALLAMPLGT